MPLLTRFFQCLISSDRTFLAGTSHRKFHTHDREPQNDQEQNVEQHKCTAASLTCHIWEFPHITDADRTPCRQQDEPQPRL